MDNTKKTYENDDLRFESPFALPKSFYEPNVDCEYDTFATAFLNRCPKGSDGSYIRMSMRPASEAARMMLECNRILNEDEATIRRESEVSGEKFTPRPRWSLFEETFEALARCAYDGIRIPMYEILMIAIRAKTMHLYDERSVRIQNPHLLIGEVEIADAFLAYYCSFDYDFYDVCYSTIHGMSASALIASYFSLAAFLDNAHPLIKTMIDLRKARNTKNTNDGDMVGFSSSQSVAMPNAPIEVRDVFDAMAVSSYAGYPTPLSEIAELSEDLDGIASFHPFERVLIHAASTKMRPRHTGCKLAVMNPNGRTSLEPLGSSPSILPYRRTHSYDSRHTVDSMPLIGESLARCVLACLYACNWPQIMDDRDNTPTLALAPVTTFLFICTVCMERIERFASTEITSDTIGSDEIYANDGWNPGYVILDDATNIKGLSYKSILGMTDLLQKKTWSTIQKANYGNLDDLGVACLRKNANLKCAMLHAIVTDRIGGEINDMPVSFKMAWYMTEGAFLAECGADASDFGLDEDWMPLEKWSPQAMLLDDEHFVEDFNERLKNISPAVCLALGDIPAEDIKQCMCDREITGFGSYEYDTAHLLASLVAIGNQTRIEPTRFPRTNVSRMIDLLALIPSAFSMRQSHAYIKHHWLGNRYSNDIDVAPYQITLDDTISTLKTEFTKTFDDNGRTPEEAMSLSATFAYACTITQATFDLHMPYDCTFSDVIIRLGKVVGSTLGNTWPSFGMITEESEMSDAANHLPAFLMMLIERNAGSMSHRSELNVIVAKYGERAAYDLLLLASLMEFFALAKGARQVWVNDNKPDSKAKYNRPHECQDKWMDFKRLYGAIVPLTHCDLSPFLLRNKMLAENGNATYVKLQTGWNPFAYLTTNIGSLNAMTEVARRRRIITQQGESSQAKQRNRSTNIIQRYSKQSQQKTGLRTKRQASKWASNPKGTSDVTNVTGTLSEVIKLATDGDRHHGIGRQWIADEIIKILLNSLENVPIIVGKHGSGKTDAIHAFADMTSDDGKQKTNVIDNVYILDANNIVNPPRINTFNFPDGTVLAIDNFGDVLDDDSNRDFYDRMISSPQSESDIAHVVEANTQGLFDGVTNWPRILLTMTPAQLSEFHKKYPKAYEYCIPIMLPNLTVTDLSTILRERAGMIEKTRKVKIDRMAIARAIDLGGETGDDIASPERELRVLDMAASNAIYRGSDTVSSDDVLAAIHTMTSSTSKHVSDSEHDDPFYDVAGQELAKDTISKRIAATRLGLYASTGPRNVFLFCGPSGVGKTMLAKRLVRMIGGTDEDVLIIPLASYATKWEIAKLTGTAPGYIGYDADGGILTRFISNHPNGVLVLDEIEKADPHVQQLFLNMFDQGWIESGNGRHCDCTRMTIVCTTNAAFDDEKGPAPIGFATRKIPTYEERMSNLRKELIRRFGAPFVGRIGDIVIFDQLDEATMVEAMVLNWHEMRNEYQNRLGFEVISNMNDGEVRSIARKQLEVADKNIGVRGLWKQVEHIINERIIELMSQLDNAS